MSVTIIEKIEKIYFQKREKSITNKEDDFFQKFESDEDLRNLIIDHLKAYLKYYESRKESWQNKFFPLLSSVNIVLAGLLGGAFANFAENRENFILSFFIVSLFVILILLCCLNIVSRKEYKICQYLSYVIAKKS